MKVRIEDSFETLLPRIIGTNAVNGNNGSFAAIRPSFRLGQMVLR
jgi:hypothetical protein